jgi:hypothetical protein
MLRQNVNAEPRCPLIKLNGVIIQKIIIRISPAVEISNLGNVSFSILIITTCMTLQLRINIAWETIRETLNISAKESIL